MTNGIVCAYTFPICISIWNLSIVQYAMCLGAYHALKKFSLFRIPNDFEQFWIKIICFIDLYRRYVLPIFKNRAKSCKIVKNRTKSCKNVQNLTKSYKILQNWLDFTMHDFVRFVLICFSNVLTFLKNVRCP